MKCDRIVFVLFDAETLAIWLDFEWRKETNTVGDPVKVIDIVPISISESTDNHEDVPVLYYRLKLAAHYQELIAILKFDQVKVRTETFAVGASNWRCQFEIV